ncbi:MAG: gamma carbonic anhydrase family protein [Spirochaetia bacterium]|nr:gamma carbonic anhydrase family protein [Spirochaetia bacterium]
MQENTSNPRFQNPAFIAPSASVTGDVLLKEDASIWHNATARGDIAPIEIGKRSNIQDGAVLHVAHNHPCIIGDDVTVGHGAIVHACTVHDCCLIGMGAIILDGAEIGTESIVGAGALVTGNKHFPPRSMILGNPAKIVRQVTDEEARKIRESAEHYITLARKARTDSMTAES